VGWLGKSIPRPSMATRQQIQALNGGDMDGMLDKHTVARSNVFILGQLLKHEVERQAQRADGRAGAAVSPVCEPALSQPGGIEGVPVRGFLSAMYEMERSKRVGEVCVFMCFIVVFLLVSFQLYDVGSEFPSLG
jgi:hypothetical protein